MAAVKRLYDEALELGVTGLQNKTMTEIADEVQRIKYQFTLNHPPRDFGSYVKRLIPTGPNEALCKCCWHPFDKTTLDRNGMCLDSKECMGRFWTEFG